MSGIRVRHLLAVSLVVTAAGCTCGDKAATQSSGQEPSRDLKPVPAPPKIELLPGAGGELAVVSARPQGPVRGAVRPTITFSKPVKSLEALEAQPQADRESPVARLEPAVEGEWRWLGSASVEFVAARQLPYSTGYQVVVPKGLKAVDGSELAADYRFSFETPRLELQDLTPSRGFRWMKPDQTVQLLFNQPVDPAGLAKALSFEVEGDSSQWTVRVLSETSIAEERRKAEEEARRAAGRAVRANEQPRGFENQQTRYVVSPEKAFPLGKAITLKLDGSLTGRQGPLSMEKAESIPFRSYGPLEITVARLCFYEECPFGPLVVRVSNPLRAESLKGKLQITPPVEIDWDRVTASAPGDDYAEGELPYLAIPGRFKPGTGYQVSIAAGLEDQFGQRTSAAFTGAVRAADLRPQLEVGAALGLVEASSGTRLPIEVVNLKTLDVRLWSLSPPELAHLLSRPVYEAPLALNRAPDFSEQQPLRYAWNQPRVHPLELSRAMNAGKTGAVLAILNSPDLRQPPKEGFGTIVQVTDLAVHLKLAPKKSLAWVTRLSTGAPVEGAMVKAYTASGAEVWSGATDASGFADIPGVVELNIPPPANKWEGPYLMAAATKDGDTSVTTSAWSSGVEAYEFGLSQGWEDQAPRSTGFVFTDRGVYRPGDKVYLKGVARYLQVGALKAPPAGSKLQVVITDERGEKVTTQLVATTRFGTFSAEVDLGKEAPTGYYRIEANGTAPGGPLEFTGDFRVHEYRAPQFQVDVEPSKKGLVAGDPLEGKLYARYLFGGAMTNARAKWSVMRSSTSFTPASGEGFSFALETWWWDDREPEMLSGFFGSGEGALDATGALEVKAGAVEAPGEKPYTYEVEAEVEDVNRQSVAARAEVMVHPSNYYVGVRAPSGFMQAGTQYGLETLVVDTQGQRTAGRQVEVSISSRVWTSVKKKDATGGFVTVSEPIETVVANCTLQSEEAPVPCRFTPAEAGFYIVKAQVSDDQKRKHSASLGVYATGEGFVSWQRNDTDRIDLLADKTSYDVGEVAHVLVKSPYPEAHALLTVEREGVLERRPVHLKGSVVTVDIPITEEMVPNVFAGILLVRPRVSSGGLETGDDPGRPSARVGLLKLDVERKTKRLSVAVSTERKEYQPGQEVAVSLEVKDHAGKPSPAEVTLYVVDEAVLRLTDYQTPDPITGIFVERPLSVRIGEPLLHLVRRRSYGEKGEPQGGGGGEGEKDFRHDFRTTVLFKPSLEVGADGKLQHRFKLPDNLTTFRIMAVAVTPEDRFGSGMSQVKVNKPVLALPALPRFARVGDRFEAGVVVHSYGAGQGEVTVTAQVEGATLEGPAEQRVQVAKGAPREVRFGFSAAQAGQARFRFRAVKGDFKDGVEENIPIELPVGMEAVATYGDTRDQRVEGIVPPAEVWPGLGGLEVTMASTAMGNFQQGMRQLVEYPYGCLEQQASRLVPFVALREIGGNFGLSWPGADPKKRAADDQVNAFMRTYLFDTLDLKEQQDPDAVISSTVKSILNLQDADGAFRYWPNSNCASSFASAYATLALSRAAAVGFEVPPERLNRAEGFLTKVAGGQCHPCELGCSDETRVFAAYVLARVKKAKPSYYGELMAKRKTLSLFAQALLADAMAIGGGDRNQANILMQEILNHAKESPRGVHFEEVQQGTYASLWHSDARTTGVVLQTLTDLAPDHPYVGKIANYLTSVRRGDGSWRSTQEAAFSLMALTAVLGTKEKDVPDFRATLALDSSSIMSQSFQGRSMEVHRKRLGIDELLKLTQGRKQPLTFKKDGTGVLYYSALLQYAPKQMPMTPLDQGLFVQRWFEPYAGGGQATRFYAGDLVRVRVRVGTSQERHWTAFEVPLPAGLEPVNSALSTTARHGASPMEEEGEGYEYEGAEDQEGGSAAGRSQWARSFWSPFNHTEMRDSKVVLFADHLPAGVHATSFMARATTPGTFLLKPASGALMYEPEVFGRSEGGSFEVMLAPKLSQK